MTLVLLAAVALTGCRLSSSATGQAVFGHGDVMITTASGAEVLLKVEVADSPDERAQGLMGRTALAPDGGMVFLVDEPPTSPFWMKNTKIPLAIAFWDPDGKIVDIQEMTPCLAEPCPGYPSAAPYVGALEANQDFFERARIAPGDTLVFTPAAASDG
jgi:hypothetical protein